MRLLSGAAGSLAVHESLHALAQVPKSEGQAGVAVRQNEPVVDAVERVQLAQTVDLVAPCGAVVQGLRRH